MFQPFLSIITINFNNAAGLRKTIESVKNQTTKNYEHIIIDGGSTDESVSVIKKFLSDSDYAKQVSYWCSENDKGIYDAMNKGILHASGKYCLFLNSGDGLTENTILETVLQKNFDEDLLYFNTNYVFNSKHKVENKKPPQNITAFALFYRCMINHQSLLIKTDLQKKHPYSLDFKIVADRHFFMTALLNENCSIKYINLTLCNFEAEDGLSSRNCDATRNESAKLTDIFFPKMVQRDLALLEDYENGYKGCLRRLRKVLMFIANKTVRRNHSK